MSLLLCTYSVTESSENSSYHRPPFTHSTRLPVPLLPSLTSAHLRNPETPPTTVPAVPPPPWIVRARLIATLTFTWSRCCCCVVPFWSHCFQAFHSSPPVSGNSRLTWREVCRCLWMWGGFHKLHCCPHVDRGELQSPTWNHKIHEKHLHLQFNSNVLLWHCFYR